MFESSIQELEQILS